MEPSRHEKRQTLCWRSLKQFCGRASTYLNPVVQWQFKPPEGVTRPRLVIRVGVAGHLHLPDLPDELETVANDALQGIRDCTLELEGEYLKNFWPSRNQAYEPPCCRVVSSLAAGADQFLVRVAAGLKYKLHAVLPAARDAFAMDILCNSDQGAVDEFVRLLGTAGPVFELDGRLGLDDPEPVKRHAYAQAGEVLLSHADLLVVILSPKAREHYGGTLWLTREAANRNIPMIVIPVDYPFKAEIVWFHEGRQRQRYLYPLQPEEDRLAVYRGVLKPSLVRAPSVPALKDTGRFEMIYRQCLKEAANWDTWYRRWTAGDTPESAAHGADVARKRIDQDFGKFVVWADNRASAYAGMYRGAYILSAVMGAAAVIFALLNVVWSSLSTFGKVMEVICLWVVVRLYLRAKVYKWKERWLNYRRLERHLNAAAWLALLGRTISVHVPAHVASFHERAAWENWFTRAVLRQARLPSIRIDREYLDTVRDLFLNGLVRDQIAYYEKEMELHNHTDERLEYLTKWALGLGLAATLGYLAFHVIYKYTGLAWVPGYPSIRSTAKFLFGADFGGECLSVVLRSIATALGAGLPACAAALAAIRNSGEYTQIAIRYAGQVSELSRIEREFERLSDDAAKNSPLRRDPDWGSAELTTLAKKTTTVLTDEVHHWHSMLFTKEIEP